MSGKRQPLDGWKLADMADEVIFAISGGGEGVSLEDDNIWTGANTFNQDITIASHKKLVLPATNGNTTRQITFGSSHGIKVSDDIMGFTVGGNDLMYIAGNYININTEVYINDAVNLGNGGFVANSSGNIAFYQGNPVEKPTVTGTSADPVVLSLVAALASLNLVIDSTSGV